MAVDPAKLLKKYQDEGCNILTPAITLEGLSEHHKATVEMLSLSPDPDYGDVYKDKLSANFIVKKQGLDKLSVLAGIIWPPEGATTRVDDGQNRDYIAFKAFGAIRKADGQCVPCQAYYDMDLIALEDDLVHQYQEKARKATKPKMNKEKQIEYVDYCVGRDMRSLRNHRATRCESGARNRVIRALLGLKQKYSKAELQKPFVAVRITYQPDYNDPETKRLITLMSLGAQGNIYGMAMPPAQLPAPPPNKYSTEQVMDAETVVPETDGPVETEQENGLTENDDTAGEDTEGKFHTEEEDDQFGLWDRKSQVKHIEKLAKTKGYDLAGLLKRMEKKETTDLSDIELVKIHDKLKSMEDDDIPF